MGILVEMSAGAGSVELWGTIPSVGNVAQPPLGKVSGERGWQAGPMSMDRFSSGKSGLHYTCLLYTSDAADDWLVV